MFLSALLVPKTPSSEGIVAIDPDTVLVLRQHIADEDEKKARLGDDWVDTDLLFTQPDGNPLHPADVADEFARLIKLAGLPPNRPPWPAAWCRDPGSWGRGGHEGDPAHASAFVDQGDDGPLHQRRPGGRC
jgi:hypothetical protein